MRFLSEFAEMPCCASVAEIVKKRSLHRSFSLQKANFSLMFFSRAIISKEKRRFILSVIKEADFDQC